MMALELSNWRAWILDTVVVLDTVLDNTHKTLSLAIKTSCHHSPLTYSPALTNPNYSNFCQLSFHVSRVPNMTDMLHCIVCACRK